MPRSHIRSELRPPKSGCRQLFWTDIESDRPGPDETSHAVPASEAFVTVDETGADALISESRTVPEIERRVREGALRELARDRRGNPRTRHLRRMRHRHGHERLR